MAEFMHKRMHDRKNNSGSSGILIQVYLNCLFCYKKIRYSYLYCRKQINLYTILIYEKKGITDETNREIP